MQQSLRSIMLVLSLLTVLSACGSATGVVVPAGYAELTGPTPVASVEVDDVDAAWRELDSLAVDLDRLGEAGGSIPGFEPFNDPRIALSGGRFLVRGRSDVDAPIAGWYQRNPAAVAPGDHNPVVENAQRPVRLFVYDARNGELTPVSHIPEVYPYSTAMIVGASPDAVLDVVVLTGERVVAYRSGFSGAAYDIVREIYVAPIPPP